jgi:hypothetical protein
MIDLITFIVYNVILILSCVMWYYVGKADGTLQSLKDELKLMEIAEKAMRETLVDLSIEEETSIKGNGK